MVHLFQDVLRMPVPPFQDAKDFDELKRMLGDFAKRLNRAIDASSLAGEAGEDHDHTATGDGGVLTADTHDSYSRYNVASSPGAGTDQARIAAVDFAAGDTRLQVVSETGEKVWVGNGAIRSAANAFTVDAAAALNMGTSVATSVVVGRAGANTTLAGDNVLVGGGTSATELRFLEPSGSGTNYTAWKAQAQAGNLTYTLPPSQTAGVLTNDGAGALTWSAASSVAAATQAEQETGTSTTVYVSPGRQQYHQSAAKGWSYFNDSGSITSYNVSSIGNVGTGSNTINWATDFSSDDYATCTGVDLALLVSTTAKAAASVQVNTEDVTATATAADTSIAAFGDQA